MLVFLCFVLVLPSFAVLDFNASLIGLSYRASVVAAKAYNSNLDVDDLIDDDVFAEELIVRQDKHSIDRTIFVRENTTCWLGFRGTAITLGDIFQDLDLKKSTICVNHDPAQGCCTVRKGYAEAYTKRSFREELDNALRSCKANCPTCDVVLTGDSQGGAAAAVAAIALKDLDPIVISFGQPGAIYGSCSLINENKFLRFINSRHKLLFHGLKYDPVPIFGAGTNHLGVNILLGDDEDRVAAWLGEPKFPFCTWDVFQHDIFASRDLLWEMLVNNITVSTNGFSTEHDCNEDFECESKQCNHHRCS